eukprot:scaffold5550_cov82-Cyclotella_meneghiniana.AAC.7
MYFTRLAVKAACAPAHNQSSGASETSQPNLFKKSDGRLDCVKAEGHFKDAIDTSAEKGGGFGGVEEFVVNAIGDPPVSDGFNKKYEEAKVAVKSSSKSKTEKGGAYGGTAGKGDGFHDIVVKPSNVVSINNANNYETEYGDVFVGSSLALKEMIKDETKATVKTDCEIDSFEEGRDLKGSGCVLKEATKKEIPKIGGDSAYPIRDITVKPSNGISINNANDYETEFGDVIGGSSLALKEMIKDETKATVKTDFELESFEEGRGLKGSGPVLKEAIEKENPKIGGDSAYLNRDIMVKPSNGISINNANDYETEFGDAIGGSSLALKEMIKDETKATVKTDFELDSFEEGRGLKGSGPVPKDATKKEIPKIGGDSAYPIRDIMVKPSNGISINNANDYETEFGDVIGGSSLALKEMIKDETKATVKTDFELDSFEEGRDLKGSGPVLKEAIKKEIPKIGGDSAYPIRDIMVKPSNAAWDCIKAEENAVALVHQDSSSVVDMNHIHLVTSVGLLKNLQLISHVRKSIGTVSFFECIKTAGVMFWVSAQYRSSSAKHIKENL